MLFDIFTYQNILFIILFRNSECETQTDYRKLDKQYTLEEARAKCSEDLLGDLPGSYPLKNLRNISYEMNKNKVNNIWLGIRKIQYDNARWINSCSVGASILKDTKPTENRQCGYINVMFKFVKLTVCDKSHELNAGFGAICEVKGCTHCLLPPSMCFVTGNSCYLIFCGINKWFEARMYCQRKENGDLPILEEKPEAVEKFSQTVFRHNKECSKYWIGFSTFAWNHFNNRTALVNDFSWIIGQPKLLGGDCVSAELYNNTYGWKVENCSTQRDVLCAKYKNIQQKTTRIEKAKPTDSVVTPDMNAWINKIQMSTPCTGNNGTCCDNKIAWAWGLSMCILLLVAVIYIIYLKKKKSLWCFAQKRDPIRKPEEQGLNDNNNVA